MVKMTSFIKILQEQATEIDELQRLIRNYKSDGPSRKNERYLTDKRRTFADIFDVIKQNHE